MIGTLRRKPPVPKSNRIIPRRTQSTHPNPPPNTHDPEKPFTLRSRPFLFAGTFIGLYQAIAAGTSLSVFLYLRYTDRSNFLLGGPIATYLLRLNVPLTNGERNVGDLVDTALRRAMKMNWTPGPQWIRQIKWWKTGGEATQDPEIIEGVLDQLEGPNSPQSRKRRKEHPRETGIVVVLGEVEQSKQPADRSKGWRETASQFGGWGQKQIERVKDGVPDQDQLRRTAGEWKDTITNANVTRFIDPQQGTVKKLTDAAATYLVLKLLFPVNLGAALLFTPGAAKWVVVAWRNAPIYAPYIAKWVVAVWRRII